MVWDWTNGWLWVIAGLLLALVELALPGYVFLGTAIALVAMGVLLLTGLWGIGLPGTLIAAAAMSLAAWLLLRRLMGVRHGQVRIWRDDIND